MDLSYRQNLHCYRKLLGEPVTGNNRWACPFCDSNSDCFVVREPAEGKATKFRCYRCVDENGNRWGDLHDVLKHQFPKSTYSDRCEYIREMLADFDFDGDGDGIYLSPVGLGTTKITREQVEDLIECPATEAWRDVIEYLQGRGQVDPFDFLRAIIARASHHGVSLQDILDVHDEVVGNRGLDRQFPHFLGMCFGIEPERIIDGDY